MENIMKQEVESEMVDALIKMLELSAEEETIILKYLQVETIITLFKSYDFLPLSQITKEKLMALNCILSYEGGSENGES